MEIGMVTEETEEGEEEVVMEIKEEVVGGIKVEEAGLSQMILELEGNVHLLQDLLDLLDVPHVDDQRQEWVVFTSPSYLIRLQILLLVSSSLTYVHFFLQYALHSQPVIDLVDQHPNHPVLWLKDQLLEWVTSDKYLSFMIVLLILSPHVDFYNV